MSTDLVVDLTAAAAQINGEHRAAEDAYQRGMRDALEHALRAGRLLNEAKGQMEHGDWLPWLDEHVDFSRRRAQEYMQLADKAPELEDARTTAHLTIDDALRQVRKPRDPKPERVSHGEMGSLFAGATSAAPRTERAPAEPQAPAPSSVAQDIDTARARLRQGWTDQLSRKRERALALDREAHEMLARLDELSHVGAAGAASEIARLRTLEANLWTEIAMGLEA